MANRYSTVVNRYSTVANCYVASRYCGESLLWRVVTLPGEGCGGYPQFLNYLYDLFSVKCIVYKCLIVYGNRFYVQVYNKYMFRSVLINF